MLESILFFFLASFPSASKTAWMEPAAFHLKINMTKADAVKALEKHGWTPAATEVKEHLVVKYEVNKTVTLAFSNDRLQSVRFELVDFVPRVKDAFAERQTSLKAKFGKAQTKAFPSETILIYDSTTPNIFVVFSKDPKSSFGKQGLGFLVVRYFDPAGAV